MTPLLSQVHEADACLVLANKYCPDPDAEVSSGAVSYHAGESLLIAGRRQHHEGHLHQELLGQHQGHHPADAVSQQGRIIRFLQKVSKKVIEPLVNVQLSLINWGIGILLKF